MSLSPHPSLIPTSQPRRRWPLYLLTTLAFAILLAYLAGPALSNRIVPSSAPGSQVQVALVIKAGQPWLVLPRSDGTSAAFAFAPQSPPGSGLSALFSSFSSQPAVIIRSQTTAGDSLAKGARDMAGEELFLIDAPEAQAFALADRLDALILQNAGTLTVSPQTGALQVAISQPYSSTGFNANQWTADRLRELDARVQGLGILTRWSVEPFTP
jgi:hypothetical protein